MYKYYTISSPDLNGIKFGVKTDPGTNSHWVSGEDCAGEMQTLS